MRAKANTLDMKKTMAEVAANIESRVSYDDLNRFLEAKMNKSDLNYLLQGKVSYEELK